MPLRRLERLAGAERNDAADRHLGYTLAAVAGAVNAGGFLAIGAYTSHMTGIVSGAADHLALGDYALALAGLAAWSAFVAGAAATALMVNWGRRRGLHGRYALPLLAEAVLLLAFGMAGARLPGLPPYMAPLTVLLLCFIMGLQNAIITKLSGARIRTTHVTGMSTDIGIELGKLAYVNRPGAGQPPVRADRARLRTLGLLTACFLGGGVAGALGFKHIGFGAALAPAAVLAVLGAMPVLRDLGRGDRAP